MANRGGGGGGRGALYRFMTPSGYPDDPATAGWTSISTALEENTTAHGIHNFGKAKGTVKRLFWALVMVLMGVGLVFNIVGLVQTYLGYPVTVTVSMTQERRLVFPAVTLCNMNPVKKSSMPRHFGTIARRRKRSYVPMCGVGWSLYNDHCYYISTNFTDQPSADRICQSMMASLTSAEDQAELDFLTSITGKNIDYWIGLKKLSATPNGTTYWMDGSNSTFRLWFDTEPNENTVCVRLSDGAFRDRSCSEHFNFICKTVPDYVWMNPTTTPEATTTGEAATTTTTTKATKTTAKASTTTKTTTMTKTTAKISTTATRGVSTTATPTVVISRRATTSVATTTTTAIPTTSTVKPTSTTLRSSVITRTPATTVPRTAASTSSSNTIPKTSTPRSEPETTLTSPQTTASTSTSAAVRTSTHVQLTSTAAAKTATTQKYTDPVCTTADFTTTTTAKVTSRSSSPGSTPPWPPVGCCCDCCRWNRMFAFSVCHSCTNDSLTGAVACAAASLLPPPPPPPPTESDDGVPNFDAPATVPGSRFPDRPVYRDDFQEQQNLTESLAAMSDRDRSNVGYSVGDLIVDCQFDGVDCNVTTDFTRFSNPIHGNCYIFNSGWVNHSNAVKVASRSGPRHGLVLLVNIQQDEYVVESGDIAGIRVVVLPQNRIPFPEDDGIMANPGRVTSVGLFKTTVRRQPAPYGNCAHGEDREHRSVYSEKYQVEYSAKGCMKTCLQKYIVDRCLCADPYVPVSNGLLGIPICSSNNVTQDDCVYEVTKLYTHSNLPCYCPERCEDTFYSLLASTSSWPSEASEHLVFEKLANKRDAKLNFSTVEDLQQNVLKLEVFFESILSKDISEVPAYELINLISDVGGVVGLWFGFAFMTFVEFLEFFVDILVLLLSKVNRLAKH